MAWFPFRSKNASASPPGAEPEKHDERGDPIMSPNSSAKFTGFNSGSDQPDSVRDVRCDILASFLHDEQAEREWFRNQIGEGVFVKKSKGAYACSPASVATDGSGIYEAIAELNVRVCLPFYSRSRKGLTRLVRNDNHLRPNQDHRL
jgi:hypothetical protein